MKKILALAGLLTLGTVSVASAATSVVYDCNRSYRTGHCTLGLYHEPNSNRYFYYDTFGRRHWYADNPYYFYPDRYRNHNRVILNFGHHRHNRHNWDRHNHRWDRDRRHDGRRDDRHRAHDRRDERRERHDRRD